MTHITDAQVEAAISRLFTRGEIIGPINSVLRAGIRYALEDAERAAWRPIEEAPKDGTPIDVWLGRPEDDGAIDFYCVDGSRRSCAWSWHRGKFRPIGGLVTLVFVQPTHFRPLPPPPEEAGR